MAYYSDRHVMVLFGGSTRTEGPFVTNETWELVGVDCPFIMEQPVSQFAQPGQRATVYFTVKAMGPPGAVTLEQMSRTVGNDAYYKGAYVVHMLRFLIGREQTLTLLRRFAYSTLAMERAANGSACRYVTTSDFIRSAEKTSGRKLGWFFGLYLDQPRLPKLVSEVKGDKLLLRWETPPGFAFPMPVEIKANGNITRIEMPKGRAELSATCCTGFQLDPQGWILKE